MKTPEVDQFGILWRQFTDRRIGLETIGPSSWNDVWIYIYIILSVMSGSLNFHYVETADS